MVCGQNASLPSMSLSTMIIKHGIRKTKFRRNINEDNKSQQKHVDTLKADKKQGILKIDDQNDRKTYQEKGRRCGKGQSFIDRERYCDKRDQYR